MHVGRDLDTSVPIVPVIAGTFMNCGIRSFLGSIGRTDAIERTAALGCTTAGGISKPYFGIGRYVGPIELVLLDLA